jgi:hypothetical protein
MKPYFLCLDNGTDICIKIIRNVTNDTAEAIHEYRTLKTCHYHPNFPDFYGAYRVKALEDEFEVKYDLWLVMEVYNTDSNYILYMQYKCNRWHMGNSCFQFLSLGSIGDLVKRQHFNDKGLMGEHVAYILKETISVIYY